MINTWTIRLEIRLHKLVRIYSDLTCHSVVYSWRQSSVRTLNYQGMKKVEQSSRVESSSSLTTLFVHIIM